MRFGNNFLDIAGVIVKNVRKFDAQLDRGVTRAARQTLGGLKIDLRAQVAAAGLGPRMEKTWQGQVYPKDSDSKDAAVYVFSKAPKIILAFDRGVTIKSKDGWYLAVPTDNAPREYLGKKVTPSNWPKGTFGPLRYVYRKGGPALLVADDLRESYGRKTGELKGFRKANAKKIAAGKARLVTVVMFVLLPQVTLAKKLDVQAAAERWIDRFSHLITENLDA